MNHESPNLDDERASLQSPNSNQHVVDNAQAAAYNITTDDGINRFQNILQDSDQELYPGCTKFSKLSFILRLFHLKCLFG